MNARTIRRAAERKAEKIARKAQHDSVNSNPISPAQQAANQANAQLSTGPRTETGKQTSSRNAVKTGLTGQTVILSTDNMPAYEALLTDFTTKYNPATPEERELVQSLVDSTWRLRRIVSLEYGIYAIGNAECAEEFTDLDPANRSQIIQLQTYLKYEKSLRNLSTQESRLQRQLKNDTAELNRLQAERQEKEQAQSNARPTQPVSTQQNGFVFSTPENIADSDLHQAEEPACDSVQVAA